MAKEVWKLIEGYGGLYEVSDLGNVRSLDRVIETSNGQVRKYRGKELSKNPDRDGFLRAMLYSKGKSSIFFIHRLVLEAFVGKCPEGMVAKHLDGDLANNQLSNLKWGKLARS